MEEVKEVIATVDEATYNVANDTIEAFKTNIDELKITAGTLRAENMALKKEILLLNQEKDVYDQRIKSLEMMLSTSPKFTEEKKDTGWDVSEPIPLSKIDIV